MNMTRDEQKTKAELLQELDTLCERVSGLKQTVEEWSKTFDATPDLVFVQDKDFKFVKVNKSFCDVFKVKPEDLIGKKCYEVLHKSDKPWPNCPLAKTLKDKRPHQEELYDPNIGIPLLINTSPLFDENGELTGAVHIAKDITERKKVEEKLHKSEQRYRSLTDDVLDSSRVGIFILDDSFKIVWVNQAMEHYFGLRKEDVIGKDKRQLIHKQIKDIFEETETFVEKVLATYDNNTYIENFECHVLADGQRENRWLEHWSQPIHSGLFAGGRIEHYTDITDRKKATEALHKSEKKYRGLTESLSELVYRAEPKTFVATYVNNTVERFYGYSAEEWLRDPSLWENLIHPDDKERVLKEFEETKRKLKSGVIKYRIINKNKTVRWVEDHVSWEKDQQGKVISMNGVMYDITEHQKAEERQTLRFEISKTFHQQKSLKNICKKIVSLIKEHLDCEVVALRMKDGDDYPYFVNNGFSQKFIKSENYLCIHDEKGDCLRDSRGHLVLACMCGIVINAKFNQDKTFFAKEGSFWTNSTSDLIASTTTEDRGGTTRNVCNQNGYESVALILIKVKGDNIGLLQINDKRRNLFSLDIIQFLEELGHIIGIAIESKKAEEEIEKFKKMADLATHGCVMADPDGNLTYVNDSFARMHGYAPAELIGKNLEIFHTDAQRKHVGEINKRLMETGQGIQGQEVWHVRQDGTEFPTLMSNWLLKDDNGNPFLMCGTAIDITDRKKAQEALRESEERLRVALFAAQMGTWRWDPVTNQDTRDASLNRILGLEAVESTQPVEDFLHFVHPEDRDMVDEEIQRAIRERRTYMAEFRIIRPDGTVRWLRDQGKPLCDENDRVLCLTGAIIDITERKKAEEVLRESEERYKALFECTAEGIIVADTETKEFKYANPAICKMLGYTEEELGRLGVRDIHPKEDLQHIISEFEAQARGEKTLSPSIPCLRKDGTIMYADINTAMVLIDGRQCNVGFFTDITERKRIKAELENYKEKVLQAQKHAYIASMGSIVAHQLNQPLTTINMLLAKALELEQAKDNCCPPVLQRIEKSLTEAQKAASIIRKFHQYSRDPTLETTTKVNVSSIVNRIIFMLSERAEQAKINISTRSLDDLPEVEINETALEQLFLIIIQNAIEASDGRKKHRLNIGGGFADSKIELQFSDDCCGIAPENLDKIFEPFFSTKSDSKGIGLGLDIVQQILISYGGEIRVESQFGKGATFYVTLPAD